MELSNAEEVLDRARKSLEKGELKKALSSLINTFDSHAKLRELQGRLHKVEKDFINGFISYETKTVEHNKILKAVTDFIDEETTDSERNETEKKRDLYWKSFIIILLVVCGLYVGRYVLPYVFFSSEKREQLQAELDQAKVRLSQVHFYKILILPLNPYKSCQLKENKLETILLDRYTRMREEAGLNIQVNTFIPQDCQYSKDYVKKIGREKNADLVIWGRYIENCTDEQIDVSFNLVNPRDYGQEDALFKSWGDFIKLDSPVQLLSDSLVNEIDLEVISHAALSALRYPKAESLDHRLQNYFDVFTNTSKYLYHSEALLNSLHSSMFIHYLVELEHEGDKYNRASLIAFLEKRSNFFENLHASYPGVKVEISVCNDLLTTVSILESLLNKGQSVNKLNLINDLYGYARIYENNFSTDEKCDNVFNYKYRLQRVQEQIDSINRTTEELESYYSPFK